MVISGHGDAFPDALWSTRTKAAVQSPRSSSEKSCIEQMTERYLDTSKFVLARFQNQAQQAQGGGGFS